MFIDVTDETTFPAALKDAVYEFFDALDGNTSKEIREHVLESNSSVGCIADEYFTESSAPSLYNNVVSILKQCSLICYHATRVLNVEDIKNHGLRVNYWDRYSASLIKTLKALYVSESDINFLMELVKKEYEFKYTEMGRNPQICFYTRLDLANNDGIPFLSNIGGELVRRPLNNRPELHKKYESLYRCGTPVIVKAVLPFTDLATHLHPTVAGQFIRFYMAKRYWEYAYKIDYDCYTDKDVTAEQIMDIIPVQA